MPAWKVIGPLGGKWRPRFGIDVHMFIRGTIPQTRRLVEKVERDSSLDIAPANLVSHPTKPFDAFDIGVKSMVFFFRPLFMNFCHIDETGIP